MLFKKKADTATSGTTDKVNTQTAPGGPGVQLSVEGMSCKHCVMRTDKALRAVPGVADVQVDLESKTAVVQGSGLDQQTLKQAVEEAGYSVTAIKALD